jgi:hypothetical protein
MRAARGERMGTIKDDQEGVRIQEGFLWESALEYMVGGMSLDGAMDLAFRRYMIQLREGHAKQVQVERDGIHMTPDAFWPREGVVESYKCTRKTLRKALVQADFEENHWAWIIQEKAYALAMGVDTTRWVVLWAAGDYSRGPGSGPQVLESTAVWTPAELLENWAMVLKAAEELR